MLLRGLRKISCHLGLLAVLMSMPACGEATFFFIWNTGTFGDPRGGFVGVFVIGEPSEEPLEEVVLVDGRIPRGMAIQSDGTIQGIPEETGDFVITLGLKYLDGRSQTVTYEATIE